MTTPSPTLDARRRETLLSLSTPLLADARFSLGLPEAHLDSGIKPVVPFTRMVGTALTVRLETAAEGETGDLSPMVRAYESGREMAHPIMVVQVPAEAHEAGIVGGGAATMALQNGFVGALVEGAVRDTHDLRDMGFPVFARAISPGYIVGKVSATAVGEPVQVGGRTISAGDAIVGDNDGVIALPLGELEAVIERAAAIQAVEHSMHSQMALGRSVAEARDASGPMP